MLRHWPAVLLLGLAACAPSVTRSDPFPAPAPAAPEAVEVAPEALPAPTDSPLPGEAPRGWHLLDFELDGVPGAGVHRAHEALGGGDAPVEILVAVIDGGVDTAHVQLRPRLSLNSGEIPGNGADDDGNGYVDDLFGWNFLGGPDGESVHHDTWEVTRLTAGCRGGGAAAVLPPDPALCPVIEDAFEERRSEAAATLRNIGQIRQAMTFVDPLLRRALGTDSLTVTQVREFRPMREDLQQARAIYLELSDAGITPELVEEAETEFRKQLDRNLDLDFNPRPIVGDRYEDPRERIYGNADVTGPDSKHGTHVAGIIAALPDAEGTMRGIAPSARILSVRAVPDGDEHDKDVANAIRYAVDRGARIINMSFGKDFSPQKAVVDEAVRYAQERGVLLIHAAGNDGENLAENENFPNRRYGTGGEAELWIEVGASSWTAPDSLAAPFSNYGADEVDIFAPGVAILSTVPGGAMEPQDGTSMAAPVVSGVAALLMAHFPTLSAAEVREILLESGRRYPNRQVARPGGERGDPTVPFGSLSRTGAIVNAFEAVRLARDRVAGGE